MSLNFARLPALAFAALLVAAPSAFAFSVEPAPVNQDGSARFADPDSQLDKLTEQRQDARDSGSSSWSYSTGSTQYGMSTTRGDHSYWGSPMLDTPRY